jgi:hypothetical protein
MPIDVEGMIRLIEQLLRRPVVGKTPQAIAQQQQLHARVPSPEALLSLRSAPLAEPGERT